MQPIYLNSESDLAGIDFDALPSSTRVSLGNNDEEASTLEDTVRQLFRAQLAMQEGFAFDCLWNQALANREICWTNGRPLDLGTLRAIRDALNDAKIFHGEGVSVSTSPDDGDGGVNKVHALTEYLLGKNDLPGGMTGAEALAIFYEETGKDSEAACRLFTQEFQEILLKTGSAELPEPGTDRAKLFQMFIGSVIAGIPFAYPKPDEDTFAVPVIIDGQWVVCNYEIERIELTPGPFTPLLAFGLTAPNQPEAPPLLTFSGTTWDEGRFAGILADCTPFMSIGHAPYLLGKEKIAAWFHRQHKPARLFGTSLGGALCFHTLAQHANAISNVDVYNSPGLYSYFCNSAIDGPEVNIYMQENDIASSTGYLPTGSNVHVYRVLGEQLDGWREAHGRAYGGGKTVTMVKSSPEYENSRWARVGWTSLLFAIGLTVGAVLWTFYLLSCVFYALKVKACELLDCCQRTWSYDSPQMGHSSLR